MSLKLHLSLKMPVGTYGSNRDQMNFLHRMDGHFYVINVYQQNLTLRCSMVQLTSICHNTKLQFTLYPSTRLNPTLRDHVFAHWSLHSTARACTLHALLTPVARARTPCVCV